MITHRDVTEQDLSVICQLPENETELFNMFPLSSYPLTHEQLKNAVNKRDASTVFLMDDQVFGFANLYSLKHDKSAGIGNVIVSKKFIAQKY